MSPEPDEAEPENVDSPEIDVAGKVKTEKVDADGETEKKPTYEELEALNKQKDEFLSGIYSYVGKDAEGNLNWKVDRIVDELGYDAASLKKKGEKVDEPKVEQKVVEETPKDVVAEFNKDPKAFLGKFAEEIVTKVKSTYEAENAEIKKDVQTRKIRDMISEAADIISSEDGDFYELQKEVAELSKRLPPKSAEDLVDLYHAASARKRRGEGAGLAGSNRASPRGKAKPQISPEEQIANEIVGYSKDGVKKGDVDLTKLLGKSRLAPLPGN